MIEEKTEQAKEEIIENKLESNEKSAEDLVQEVKDKIDEEEKNEQQIIPAPHKHSISKIFVNAIYVIITVIILLFTIFTVISMDNSKISNGITILNIDVSGLTKQDAINKLTTNLDIALSNEICLKYNDYETTISLSQLDVDFNIEGMVSSAFKAGQGSNAISNSCKKIALLLKPTNITPTISLNTEQLENTLSTISTQLPDAIVESSYYVEDSNLIITSGKQGVIVDIENMENLIINSISNLSFINNALEIITISKTPDPIDIEAIYSEVYKEAKDAYYTTNPYVVYPDETGIDFAITLDEAKSMLAESQDEYVIPLKTLYPSVTTNMIGLEAFPDLLSTFSTKYATSNKDRTTNLILASNKINGTVILPGETFSYNTVVGERTIAAGYKEAAIYQNGQVVNGLGGGICQISTTLYNAVLFANLEITERRNHQFVPSYVSAGRDATVVYGSQDFKFTNNRNYAIKLVSSVANGIAKIDVYGLHEDNEYEVSITSNVTSQTSSYINSVTYKTLKQNGQVVSTEVLSRDTYKAH